MPGTLFVVATPIGNLEDITLRALRILRDVDLIAAEDTRHTAKLLRHHDISTRTTSLFAHNEHRKLPMLLDRLRADQDVALVSDAGTPTISDPGSQLVAAALADGLPVVPIPGPSAVLAALSCSGFTGDRFRFEGFAPRKKAQLLSWLLTLADVEDPIVFLEAPHRAQRTLGEAAKIFGNRPIFVAREITKLHEQLVKGPILEITEVLTEWRGEFTVVIGPGQKEPKTVDTLDEPAILQKFSQLTKTDGLGRRQALRTLGKELDIAPNELYEIIERTKSSLNDRK